MHSHAGVKAVWLSRLGRWLIVGSMNWRRALACIALIAHVLAITLTPALVMAAPASIEAAAPVPCHEEPLAQDTSAKQTTADVRPCCVVLCCIGLVAPDLKISPLRSGAVLKPAAVPILLSVVVGPGDRPPKA